MYSLNRIKPKLTQPTNNNLLYLCPIHLMSKSLQIILLISIIPKMFLLQMNINPRIRHKTLTTMTSICLANFIDVASVSFFDWLGCFLLDWISWTFYHLDGNLIIRGILFFCVLNLWSERISWRCWSVLCW